ncbi:hypothetical protein LCGC14_2255330 [marine sediment metagenome]|uniref:Uncharacterized protein n=1 Tax=marine sediment metagenome TaxID=412755 RepID=A0A0F9FWD6_9ZZZZ
MKIKKKEDKEDNEFVKYTFKNQLTGLDFINSRVDKNKLISEVRLISEALIKPLKMSYEEIINLPIQKFISLFAQYRISYKDEPSKINLEGYKQLFEKAKGSVSVPVGEEPTTYQFPPQVPVSNMNPKKE